LIALKVSPVSKHWFRTFFAPLLGGIGMLYVVYLLWEHKDAAAGTCVGNAAVQAGLGPQHQRNGTTN
jgi:hypothetical protein